MPELSPAVLAREAWHILRRTWRCEMNYRMTRPSNLLPFLTYRCTSRCRTCSMWRRETTHSELTVEQWQSFFASLSELRPHALRHVEFFGGDVLLRPEVLMPLIEQAAGMGLYTAVPLNGVLLDREMAYRLVESGVDTIYVSVDGVGELHDRVRRAPGNFDQLRVGIAALRDAREGRSQPSLEAICTVSRYNAHGFEEVFPFALEAGFDRVSFEYVGHFPDEAAEQSVIDGRRAEPFFENPDGPALADRSQAEHIKRQLALMHASPLARDISLETKNIDALTIEQMVCGLVDLRRCYMSRTLVSIDPSGNVLACPFYATYPLGNILEQPLYEIWNGPAHRRFLRARAQRKLQICRHCIMSVERNPTPGQYLLKRYLAWRRARS